MNKCPKTTWPSTLRHVKTLYVTYGERRTRTSLFSLPAKKTRAMLFCATRNLCFSAHNTPPGACRCKPQFRPKSCGSVTAVQQLVNALLTHRPCCVQALTESSDLEALRREKRAIIEEERCLKALVDIEKSSGHRKAQMLAALRAEKQRHAAKADHRRKRFTESLERHFQKEAEVLREKHGVPPR